MPFDPQPESFESLDRLNAVRAAAANEPRLLVSPGGRPLARRFALRLPQPSTATATFSEDVTSELYPLADRRRIVAQLALVISDFYVHLGSKRSQYGFDPVRALELLSTEVTELPDAEFHQAVTQVIARTRDRHLRFDGRAPLGIVASLPFLVERAWRGDHLMYVVTKLEPDSTAKYLKAGAVVTHWNGVPIDRFVRLNANVFDGGNEAAAVARSIEFLTHRPLQRFAAPMEEWVDLRFEVDSSACEERFVWEGLDLGAVPATPSIGRNVIGFGGDPYLLETQHAKRVRFVPASFDPIPPAAPDAGATADPGVPTMLGRRSNFDYGTLTTDRGTFGYVRLWNFRADDVNDIARDLVAVLSQLPNAGLVIDIRGNTGGYIAAGERLLQLVTPGRITPTRFQFRVNRATARMVSNVAEFAPWARSFAEAARTGEPFSRGLPIEGSDEDANQLGQHYFGPVVLVTDALAFSTADMFAAGFIDHDIGKVICIDKNMAAAGGNNWRFDVLRLFNPDFQLERTLRADLVGSTITPAVRAAFGAQGASLTQQAILSLARKEYDGTAWRITDGDRGFDVRHVPWMNDSLNVYQDAGGKTGLEALPPDVSFGFTVRRCVRAGKSEGRLLEDLGIEPDVMYRPTLRDVMDRNRDLLTCAAVELSAMPSYRLDVDVRPAPDHGGSLLACRTAGLTAVEAYDGERFIVGGQPSAANILDLVVPSGVRRATLKGWVGDRLVARRLVTT